MLLVYACRYIFEGFKSRVSKHLFYSNNIYIKNSKLPTSCLLCSLRRKKKRDRFFFYFLLWPSRTAFPNVFYINKRTKLDVEIFHGPLGKLFDFLDRFFIFFLCHFFSEVDHSPHYAFAYTTLVRPEFYFSSPLISEFLEEFLFPVFLLLLLNMGGITFASRTSGHNSICVRKATARIFLVAHFLLAGGGLEDSDCLLSFC